MKAVTRFLTVVPAIIISFQYPLIIYYVVLLIIKELYLTALNFFLIKKELPVVKLDEKKRTALSWFCLILLLIAKLSYGVANIPILALVISEFISLLKYLVHHIYLLCNKKSLVTRRKVPNLLLAFLLIAYLLIGAVVPYLKHPDVSNEYKESFDVNDFYSNTVSCDRACIVENNGEALVERMRMIENAEHSLILSTFDFRTDTTGKQVLAALKAAADRGVDVKILVDGFNFWVQMEGNPYFLALMQEENIEIRVYNKINPLLPYKAMSRMHDKYIIADEKLYLLGGRNTFNYFLGDQDGHKNYDREVLVYNTGSSESSLYQLLDYFNQVWNENCCKTWEHGKLITSLPCVTSASEELDMIYSEMKSTHSDWFYSTDYSKKTVETNKITLLSNPTSLYSKEPWVFYGLCELMRNAEESALIHTPYIIADDMMYNSFKSICDSGVPVTIMTNSSANNGNAFGAVDYVLNKEKILNTGVQILEYNGGISYHAKSLLIDDNISIVGSFNMDYKSVYHDTELMLVIDSKELNSQFSTILDTYHKDTEVAVLDNNEMSRMMDKDEGIGKKILRHVIRVLDPYVRFLF